jgi:hypothetical protein
MSTVEEMAELITLWGLLEHVTLTGQEDQIRWRWTANGCYSSKSAYQAHLMGTFCSFNCKVIWVAKVEDKHRFFGWLLVQCKLLTADNLLARNWPCDQMCSLCDQCPETAEHMALHCVFAQQVWLLVSHWTDGLVRVPNQAIPMESWWNSSLRGFQNKLKQKVHYVKISNRSHSICNGPLTPITSTHIYNGCCLAPITYKRARKTPGLASTTLVTDFW